MKKYAIYYIFNENHILPLQISIVSFLLHNKWFISNNNYIILGYLGEPSKIYQEQFNKIYKNIIWINISNTKYDIIYKQYINNMESGIFSDSYNQFRYKVNVFNKFYIFDNTEFDKILYLDTDILVLNSLEYIFNNNDYLCAASPVLIDQTAYNLLYNNCPLYSNNSFISLKYYYENYQYIYQCNTGLIIIDKNINKYINYDILYNYSLIGKFPNTHLAEECFFNEFVKNNINILEYLYLLPTKTQALNYMPLYMPLYIDLNKYKVFNSEGNKEDIYKELMKYDVLHYIIKPWNNDIDINGHIFTLYYTYVHYLFRIIVGNENIIDINI